MSSGVPFQEQKSPNAKHSVVLAYNGTDYEAAEAIYKELKRRDLGPWIDIVDIRPGAEWRKNFVDAINNASAAILCFGPAGIGSWQGEEIPLIHDRYVKKRISVIPVLLPGGTLPDDLMLPTKTLVKFRDHPNDQEAFDRLEYGITGVDPRLQRGRYAIFAELKQTDLNNCFLAVSHATSRVNYEAMEQAALESGLIVNQAREWVTDPRKRFTPEVVMAIRSATIILADATPELTTRKPDADVMYEVGLAQAFAKPIIYVSPPLAHPTPLPMFSGHCIRVEYEAAALEHNQEDFKRNLVEQIKSHIGEMKPLRLVRENDMGLRVAYSELHYHCPEFWQPYEQIMHYGLTIKKVFAEILKPAHKMQHVIEQALADSTDMRLDLNSERLLGPFRSSHDEFCMPHLTFMEHTDDCALKKAAAAKAFEALLRLIDIPGETHGPFRDNVRIAFEFSSILADYLALYMEKHKQLIDRIEAPLPSLRRQVISLNSEVQLLVTFAEQVSSHACEMMFQLLELLGLRNEPNVGGK